MRPESPSEYIKKHLDIISPEQIKVAKQRLSQPFGETNLTESGQAHLVNPPFTVDFTYGEVGDKQLYTSRGEALSKDNIRELKTFSLIKDGTTQKLDLVTLLPPDYKVYFMQGSGDVGWSSYILPGENYIVLNMEPNTPESLLHLLHEIGHGHTLEQGDHEFTEEKERLRSGPVTHLADELLEERNAWSYALRKLKPFLDTQPKQNLFTIDKTDVLTLMKGRFLQSYQKNIEKIAIQQSGLYMSKAEEEWMMGGMSDFD